jgi:hypothetical protein
MMECGFMKNGAGKTAPFLWAMRAENRVFLQLRRLK